MLALSQALLGFFDNVMYLEVYLIHVPLMTGTEMFLMVQCIPLQRGETTGRHDAMSGTYLSTYLCTNDFNMQMKEQCMYLGFFLFLPAE